MTKTKKGTLTRDTIHTLAKDDLMQISADATIKAASVKNPYWKRAYYALADAADRLHAMTIRAEDVDDKD